MARSMIGRKAKFGLSAVALLALSACAGGYGPGPGYAGAPDGSYFDAYYDGGYGPFYDGYWGRGNVFYYSRGEHDHFHADRGGHFHHEMGGGMSQVHGLNHFPAGAFHGARGHGRH